jgi:polysaccharide deacetylase 2 family uncharacterized protein YibQ
MKTDVFLDSFRAPAAIQHQIYRFLETARKNAIALAIGHPYPVTLKAQEYLSPV